MGLDALGADEVWLEGLQWGHLPLGPAAYKFSYTLWRAAGRDYTIREWFVFAMYQDGRVHLHSSNIWDRERGFPELTAAEIIMLQELMLENDR